jgi:hypothetical protein
MYEVRSCTIKLVFYRIKKARKCAPGKLVVASKKAFSGYANFNTRRSAIYSQDARMKFRISKVLRFWVDVEYEGIKNHHPGCTRNELLGQVLRKFEEAGDAMRYLNKKREIAWKAAPRMLTRLADAEQEAIDDMEDWP